MTYRYYPYPIPASLGKLMAAILEASYTDNATYQAVGWKYRLLVKDPRGHIRWESPWFVSLTKLASAVRVPRDVIRWKFVLQTVLSTFSIRYYQSFDALPLRSPSVSGLLSEMYSLADIDAIGRKAHRKVTRLKVTRRTQHTSRVKTSRPNPEVYTRTFPYMVLQNNTLVTNTSEVWESYRRSWTGTTTPRFAHLKGRHLPVNPHSVDLIDDDDQGFTETISWGRLPLNSKVTLAAYKHGFGTSTNGNSPSVPSHMTSVRNKAIARLIDKCEAGTQANLAQDLAQLSQTAEVIASSTVKIASSLRALRKKDFSGAIKHLWSSSRPSFKPGGGVSHTKTLANNWLELQYGWKPLLMDVRESMESLAKFNLSDFRVNQVTASAKGEFSTIQRCETVNHVLIGTHWERIQTFYRYGIHYRVDDRLKVFLAQSGFTNPVNLAWEILPYSFVVDWFLPVGAFLDSISAWDGLVFLQGYETAFTRQVVRYGIGYIGYPDPGEPTKQYEYHGGFSRERILLNRTKLTSFPSVKMPTLKSPLSVTHAANGLALLRNVFRR